MIGGSCLCGGIRFRLDGRLGPVAICHCIQCRKANGSAFACNASVRTRAFEIASGRELIREFESSPGKFRAFCSRCGSPVYSRVASDPERVRLRLGLLDDDPGKRPLFHVFVGSKAPWFEIADSLPQFETLPPAPPAPAVPDAPS